MSKLKFWREKLDDPAILLYLSLVVGILLTIAQAVFSVDLYRDSANVYSFMERALVAGNFHDAIHPAIPSFNVLLAYPLTFLGFRPEQALGTVSCLLYVLSIAFFHYLLKEFLPERAAGVGTMLYAFAPKIIRFFCSAIIDSGKMCFLIGALYFAHRLIDKRFGSRAAALGLGAMLGCLALARSEGIGIAAVIAGCVAVYYLIEFRRSKKCPPLLPVLAAALAFAVLIASRMWLIYIHSGEWIFDSRIAEGINGIIAKFSGAASTAANAVPVRPRKVSLLHLLNQNLRGGYELYLVFAAVGIILFILAAKWKDCARIYPDKKLPPWLKWNSFYLVFIAVILSNIMIFRAADIAAYRYFLLNIPMLMIFTVAGTHWGWSWCAKYIPSKLLCAGAVVLLFFQVENGAENFYSKSSRRRYDAGLYIGKLLDVKHNTGRVWFRNACIEWYYSGMRRAVPVETALPDAATFRGFDYVLWSVDEDDLDKLEARKDLKEIPLPPWCKSKLFQKIQPDR